MYFAKFLHAFVKPRNLNFSSFSKHSHLHVKILQKTVDRKFAVQDREQILWIPNFPVKSCIHCTWHNTAQQMIFFVK